MKSKSVLDFQGSCHYGAGGISLADSQISLLDQIPEDAPYAPTVGKTSTKSSLHVCKSSQM